MVVLMKKRSKIFDKNYSPYGIYDDNIKGNPTQWAESFKDRMTTEQIIEILGNDNPWFILGIVPGSSPSEIKAAYRKRALETHPDHNPLKHRSEFQKVQAAYERLTT